jgi:probable rRNA maturation factor
MHTIIIQFAADKSTAPKASLLRKWAKAAISRKMAEAEVTIRIVAETEMTELNKTFRYKDGPTNVLSFPFVVPEEVEIPTPILGDVVICADVVNREAKEQGKTAEAHWAHMVIHGIFHLLGYDHQTDHDAHIMESLEIDVLNSLDIPNPYQLHELNNPHDN